MAVPPRFAFRTLNELTLQTFTLARLRLALVDLRIQRAQAAKVGHQARVAAFAGGTAAIFLAILGTAPADRWQYWLSLVAVLAVGLLALRANQSAYREQERQDRAIDREVEKARRERQIILDETGFSDSYRDCVMLHAAAEAIRAARGDPDEATWAKERVNFWKGKVSVRLERATAARAGAAGDDLLDLEEQVRYLESALVAAGRDEPEGATT